MIRISELVRRNFGKRAIAVSATAALACAVFIPGCGQSTPQPVGQLQTRSGHADSASSSTQAVTAEESAPVAEIQSRAVQWNEFPFMTSSDAVVSVIQPAALASSPAVRSLLSVLPTGRMDLPISPSETEWVAIYAAPLVDDDGSLTGDTTMVLKFTRPSSVYEVAESRFDSDQFEDVEVDGRSYLRVSGLSEESVEITQDEDGNTSEILNLNVAAPMAVYEHDEFTFVVCEEGRLPFVLAQSENESSLRSLVGEPDRATPLFVAASFQNRPILSDALQNQTSTLDEEGVLQKLAANAESVVLTGDLEGQSIFTLSLTGSGTENADAIESSVRSSAEAAQEFLQQMQAFAAPETKSLFETGQNLVKGVSVSRHGNTVDVAMTNPGDLPEFFSSLATLFSQQLAAK